MFTQEWRPVRVTPLGAVYRALHEHLTGTSETATVNPERVRNRVMEMAAKQGVQTDRPDPYDVMVHYSYMAEVLARTLRQPSQGPLEIHPQVGEWQPESYLMDGGTKLMRVILADRWDDDRQMSELHGWRTVGDVCVTGLPMQLRVLVIGGSREGKRHGHWTRARQHPYTKEVRFQRKGAGKSDGFAETYKTVWREESHMAADKWIEQMARDQVLGEVAFTRNVIVPQGRQREMVIEDIARVEREMQGVTDAGQAQFPMTRSACDLAGPGRSACLFQSCCYSPVEIGPEETGLFERRK